MSEMGQLKAREITRLLHPRYWSERDHWIAVNQALVRQRYEKHLANLDVDLDAVWDRHMPPEPEKIKEWQPPRWGIFYWLRRLIVRAAPTCTLWVEDVNRNVLHFRFYKQWTITHSEITSHR